MIDYLLHLDSYPEATSNDAIDQAIGFVSMCDGHLTALAIRVLIRQPSNALANALVGVSSIVTEEQAKSARSCIETTTHFESQAKALNIFEGCVISQAEVSEVGDCVAAFAKTRDVCLVPVASDHDGQRAVAETVVFSSGRPVLLFRPSEANLPCESIGTVVLAWDNSRTAARAMADALPLLKRAEKVRVLTVINEKQTATQGIGGDVVRHLKMHGVSAEIVEIDGAGKSIGSTLDAYLDQNPCDLLVMGAYGKSRIREFILGGATAHVLARVKTPLFLVH